MNEKSFNCCMCETIKFSIKHNVVVPVETFKDVMVTTLAKLARISKQIECSPDEYLPLLFADCLKEHYMFELTINGVNMTKAEE
ncbi:MAG: hypothetical protein IKP95_09220 [Ruminococcus sp.]|nr:hypothetical protein [Ruminococcus sp.]